MAARPSAPTTSSTSRSVSLGSAPLFPGQLFALALVRTGGQVRLGIQINSDEWSLAKFAIERLSKLTCLCDLIKASIKVSSAHAHWKPARLTLKIIRMLPNFDQVLRHHCGFKIANNCCASYLTLICTLVETEADLITEDKPFFNPKFTH